MRTRCVAAVAGCLRAWLVGFALFLSASPNAWADPRVGRPVPGLYHGIDPAKTPQGWWAGQESRREVVPFAPAKVYRARTESYATADGALQVGARFMPLQRSLQITATGAETHAGPKERVFAYERLLKNLGVSRGGLRTLQIAVARDKVTDAPREVTPSEEALREAMIKLPSVMAARDLLESTGHRVVDMKVVGVDFQGERHPLDARYRTFVGFEAQFKVTNAKKPLSQVGAHDVPAQVRFVGLDRDVNSDPIVGDVVQSRTTYLRSNDLPAISGRSEITRSYSAAKRELVLDQAYRREQPSFIEHSGPNLIEGRGTPTVTWATLHQMKQFGIPYGGLKTIRVPDVANEKAVIDLAAVRSGNGSLDDQIRKTQTFGYIDTIATQSGHRIVSVDIVADEGRGPRGMEILRSPGDALKNYELVFHLEPRD
jgi:hypothetical protein